MVYILLCDGFEDMEAVVPCDLLRRAGIPVAYVGIDGCVVTGSQGLRLTADGVLADLHAEDAEMLVIPGGRKGVEHFLESKQALQCVQDAWRAGAWVAAICAAPIILSRLGISSGRQVCCYPDAHWCSQLDGANYVKDSAVVVDGKIITGASAGCAIPFGLALIEALRGAQAAHAVAEALVIR